MKPNTAFLKGLVKLSDTGHVPTDGSMKTERDGLYAAGDIRQDSAAASDRFRRRRRHRRDRGVSLHQGDFSLVCCLTSSIKKRRCISVIPVKTGIQILRDRVQQLKPRFPRAGMTCAPQCISLFMDFAAQR